MVAVSFLSSPEEEDGLDESPEDDDGLDESAGDDEAGLLEDGSTGDDDADDPSSVVQPANSKAAARGKIRLNFLFFIGLSFQDMGYFYIKWQFVNN